MIANKTGREVAGAIKREEDYVALKEGSLSEREFVRALLLKHISEAAQNAKLEILRCRLC